MFRVVINGFLGLRFRVFTGFLGLGFRGFRVFWALRAPTAFGLVV